MLSSMGGFVSRHKRKFIALGVVTAAGLGAYFYAKRMVDSQLRELTEIHKKMDQQKAMESDVLRLKAECSHYVVSIFLPDVRRVLMRATNPKSVTMEIKALRAKAISSPNTNVSELAQTNQLWDELKIVMITRLMASGYAVTMLDLLVRVQFHVLSRKAMDDSTSVTPEVREAFIYQCTDFLVNCGIQKLVDLVHIAVADSSSSWTLGQDSTVSRGEIFGVLNAIRTKMESQKGWFVECLVPPSEDESGVDATTRQMVDETMDLLECPAFDDAYNKALDAVFAELFDDMSRRSFEPDKPRSEAALFDESEKFKLDKPVIMGLKQFGGELLRTSLEGGLKNKYARILESCEHTEKLCRDVYGLEDSVATSGGDLGLSSDEMKVLSSLMGGGAKPANVQALLSGQ